MYIQKRRNIHTYIYIYVYIYTYIYIYIYICALHTFITYITEPLSMLEASPSMGEFFNPSWIASIHWGPHPKYINTETQWRICNRELKYLSVDIMITTHMIWSYLIVPCPNQKTRESPARNFQTLTKKLPFWGLAIGRKESSYLGWWKADSKPVVYLSPLGNACKPQPLSTASNPEWASPLVDCSWCNLKNFEFTTRAIHQRASLNLRLTTWPKSTFRHSSGVLLGVC